MPLRYDGEKLNMDSVDVRIRSHADSVPSDAVQRATAIAPTSKEVFLGAQCLYLCLMVVFEGAADSIGHT
jgi:hypothetical protein